MDWVLKRFKELDVEELYEILKFRSEIFVVEQNCAYQDCDGKDRAAYHLYRKKEGQIVAYLRILDKGVSFDEIAIGRVLVPQQHRGCGQARELMNKAIEFVNSELGEDTIRIQAQTYLKSFYESLGFRVVSEEYLEDGILHTDMLWLREQK